jgi:PAS domain S-box-containing protein
LNRLWILSRGHWIERAIPLSPFLNTGLSNKMAALPDNRVAIPIRNSLGTSRLILYDSGRDRFETANIPGEQNCAFIGARGGGRAWAACARPNRRITIYSGDGRAFERSFELPVEAVGEWPRAIRELRDGSILVGGFWPHSLFRYAGGAVHELELPAAASGMGVSDIAESAAGRVWIGGRGMVLEANPAGWSVVQRNLETVRMIYPARDSSVWIAAGAGVLRCFDDNCVMQSSDDGLPDGVAWSLFEDSGGRLLAATTAGVRFRDPTADRDAPVAGISRQLNVNRFAPGGDVRIVPEAADRWRYTAPERLLFSYRVDGKPWSPFETLSVISLKGVGTGAHTLQLRAMDRNFNIGPPASYDFQVLAPWYRQPPLVAAALLALSILAFSILQHIDRHRELRYAVESTTRRLTNEFEEHSRTQARFELILDHAPMLVYVKDLEGRYLISNRRYCEVLGKSRDDLAGKTNEQVFGPGVTAPFTGGESEVLATDQAAQFEETDPRFSRTYLALKFPLHGAPGIPNAVCGILTDITETKQVQERAQHSQRLESVGLLAGGVAHDFNNLLTVINGYSEFLLTDPVSDTEWRSSLSEIRSAGERAAGLTAQLLAFSRKQQVQPVVLNPGDLIADLEKMLRRLIREDIELITRPSPMAGNIRVDPTQFQQVVINLVVNARDAMPDGGRLSIDVSSAAFTVSDSKRNPEIRPGAYVVVSVSDSGIGMASDVQARIFEPFFTTKELGRGTGLGLASVYGMVKQSGGWISVESEVGRGTTFKVYLPRDDGLVDRPQSTEKMDLYGREMILVVEDQREVRELTVKMLRAHGYTVHEAESASDALSFCRASREHLDLLVTDVVMPGMNGQELARQMKEIMPGVRVLFMSGYPDDIVTHEGLLDARSNYLQKPFTPEALARKVRKVLANDVLS